MYCRLLNNEMELEQVGAKAFNLSGMIRNGFPVPPGFVVRVSAFEEYQKGNCFPPALADEIKGLTQQVGAKKYMVRSSAVGEDSEENSFAGQLESFISDPDEESLTHHIISCWKSYHKAHVKVYQEKTGKRLKGMGVVIQELIEPDYAGVLFTRSLLKEGHMMAEYVEGHGEKLVSGQVNPERFHCSRDTPVSDRNLPFCIKKLHATSVDLEKFYRQPLDIEWVIKEGKYYVVQSRPVTTRAKGPRVFWSNTNVNENYPEAITPLLYSVARESYYHYFKTLSRLLRVPGQKILSLEDSYSNVIGIFGCRMYYNMSSIHSIIKASPFAAALIKSFDHFVGYQGNTNAAPAISSIKDKLGFTLEFAKLNLRLKKNVKAFEERADAYQQEVSLAFELPELSKCFYQFLEIRMHSWYKASCADFFAMVYHGLLGRFCRKHYPEGHEGISNQLIQAIPGIISNKPVIETWKILNLIRADEQLLHLLQNGTEKEFLSVVNSGKNPQLREAIDKYLHQWGFRCSGELLLTKPNYLEQPESFILLLKQYSRLPKNDPEEIIAQKFLQRKQITKIFSRKILRKRALLFPLAFLEIRLLRLLVFLCSEGISGRERVRLKQALLYYQFKLVVLKIGKIFRQNGLLEEAEDIFFLQFREIGDHLNGSDMLPQQVKRIVSLRKEQFNKNKSLVFPDDFSTYMGEYPSPEQVIQEEAIATASGEKISGLSACGGYIKGKARVLESIMEAHKLQPGDILVTRQTDPGWAGVFPLISGLVVERGGMLSHGAIVAREFGIPAIVGVHRATELIADGEEITLDADKGEIYKDA